MKREGMTLDIIDIHPHILSPDTERYPPKPLRGKQSDWSRERPQPFEQLVAEADICMISGFVGVLLAIEQGKELRLVGAAMLLPALAVYTRNDDIRRVEHLVGRTVGVGATNGLLHILMLALLRKKGIDSSKVE